MEAKEKAIELIKITFEKICNSSNYKGVNHDGGKQFSIIEKLSKKIAQEFVDEIIEEVREYADTNFHQERMKYWQEVKKEIELI
jgi:hypothetical protein